MSEPAAAHDLTSAPSTDRGGQTAPMLAEAVAPPNGPTRANPTPPTASRRPQAKPAGGQSPMAGTLRVLPWVDPLLDPIGHDPRSAYVERFWLPVLGPSTTWLLRRLAMGLDRSPEGFLLDRGVTARSIGLGHKGGRNNPFLRALDRACEFGMARYLSDDVLTARRRLPRLSRTQVERLPEPLRTDHHEWVATVPEVPDPTVVRRRAERLALSLVEMGEAPEAAERQLHRWRFHPAMAHEAVTWAYDQHATSSGDAKGSRGAPTSATGPTPPPWSGSGYHDASGNDGTKGSRDHDGSEGEYGSSPAGAAGSGVDVGVSAR